MTVYVELTRLFKSADLSLLLHHRAVLLRGQVQLCACDPVSRPARRRTALLRRPRCRAAAAASLSGGPAGRSLGSLLYSRRRCLHRCCRYEWEAKRRAALMPPADKDPRLRALPPAIGPFAGLAPLDDPTRDTTITFFGFHSPVFRARHQGDGQLYALRALKVWILARVWSCF